MRKEKGRTRQTRTTGVRRTIWLPSKVDQLCEDTRRSLGVSRSRFIVNATMRYLESLSVISTKLREENASWQKESIRHE